MKGFFKDVLDGKVREVRKWVGKEAQYVDLYDDYGNTALHLAAEKGYRGVCKVLLDAGADVNQKNNSVGWTAVHYAAYEGHSDVLRMLIAHGAIPNVMDKSGDTAETYAEEWQNVECLKILKEATALIQETLNNQEFSYDSDEKTPSDSDDDDEDESSMMNWLIPPPSQPTTNINANRTNLTNTQFAKTLGNLSIDLISATNNGNENKEPSQPQDSRSSSEEDIHLSVHLSRPTRAAKNATQPGLKDADSDSLPDLSVEETVSKKASYSGKNYNDDDTESEDTLTLIKKSEDMKGTKDGTLRTVSIVDRIKNTLSPATTPPGERKNKTQEEPQQTMKINEVQGQRERSVARAFSQAREIIARERSRTRATSQAKDTTVVRGRSNLKETTIPRELLPLADHIFSLSSATIPDDMTMSCGSIFEKFTNDLDGSETEKEILIKRLKELIEVEGSQVEQDLKDRMQKLDYIDESHKIKVDELKNECITEEEDLIKRQTKEKKSIQEKHLKEEMRIGKEIVKLEAELQTILAPSQLLSTLTPTQKSSSVTRVAPVKPELTELEQELHCCGCGKVCCPPNKIYQCPEGDLICELCRGSAGARLKNCPTCEVELAGMISRNKVLENIAKKYFIAK
eukprot:TRINITY_DN53738_c0_g1_i1.p1 TRINITY_DN53738_c0_g1~~TRINITY_DN53738_c0_g1_i1.p1  ORF type:complete len:628 (+),score=157.87 TRINITY_DN53738_c0_g1_i1:133-2016(+)